jgi:uncharacterized protein (TIGR02246 family)
VKLAADDYIAIQQLYARYASAVDLGDVEGWLANWTEDGALVTTTGWAAEGRDALRSMAEAQVSNVDEKGYHWTANLVIEPTEYGASGQCYLMHVFIADDVLTEQGRPQAQLRYALHYRDELIEQDGRWLFRRRTLNRL